MALPGAYQVRFTAAARLRPRHSNSGKTAHSMSAADLQKQL